MNIEDDILLEVQIQNITPHPMYLEVVSFDPAPGFKATNYNTVPQNSERSLEDDQEEKYTLSTCTLYIHTLLGPMQINPCTVTQGFPKHLKFVANSLQYY